MVKFTPTHMFVLHATILLLSLDQFKVTAKCDIKSARKATNICQPPWLLYGNHCYLYVKSKATFDDAEAYCQSFSKPGRSSHLASVTSQDENQFLLKYAKASGMKIFKIGLYDPEKNRNFVWTDGSSSGYRSWSPGEPSPASWGEFCVNLRSDGTWNDYYCSDPKYFMCKQQTGF